MILRRPGNKSKLAKKIQAFFPDHKIYIEPFFGAGGMFFNKPKAKYNIVNDLDSDVFNLFQVVMNQKEELEEAFYLMPIHADLLDYWKKNKEEEPIRKALRFLFLSNFTFQGCGKSIHFVAQNHKIKFSKFIEFVQKMLSEVQFNNCDFRKFLKCFMVKSEKERKSFFIYVDPPYVKTRNNYSNSFSEQDASDLFNCLQKTKCKFAYSEFDNDFILNQAKEKNLNIHIIGERRNMKNRRTEILITNYRVNQKVLF